MPGESTSPWFYYISPSPKIIFYFDPRAKKKGRCRPLCVYYCVGELVCS